MYILRNLVISASAFSSCISAHTSSGSKVSLDVRSPYIRTGNLPGEVPIRKTAKYFREAGGSMVLSHYDQRFFKDELQYEDHRQVLRNLIHSYLSVMTDLGVETWLAHGTLLGWWWNGKVLPWDYDVDVQVSVNTLGWMARHLNQTNHEYSIVDADGQAKTHKYMVDINPHYVDLNKGDGQNVIDGRWIDTDNGMFIDITGLLERSMRSPGIWSCKDNHQYYTQDLWPMRTTKFEGAQARIPYNFERILQIEYGTKSLVLEVFEDHRWDRHTKEWIHVNQTQEKDYTKNG